MTDRVQLPRLYLAWPTPRHFDPGDAALDVVADVLAGGKNSRLYKRLVYDMQIAQNVSAFQSSTRLASYFEIRRRRGRAIPPKSCRRSSTRRSRGCSARRRPAREVERVAEPDRVVVLQPDGARRRVRRQGRSAERVLHRRPAIPTGSTRISAAIARCRRPISAPPPRRSCRAIARVELIVSAGEGTAMRSRTAAIGTICVTDRTIRAT